MDISENRNKACEDAKTYKPVDEKLEKIISYYRDGTNSTIKASDLLELYHQKQMIERLKLLHCHE